RDGRSPSGGFDSRPPPPVAPPRAADPQAAKPFVVGGLQFWNLPVYFGAMKKFFLFVLVAVLVAWVAKKVREV
ncbi:MAG: hypothetical protein OXH20_05620, partial [bacterium]|nr:hypothetical protein [bacterium]